MSSRRLRSAQKSTDRVCVQLTELARLAQDETALAEHASRVSSWSVGEQVEHLRRSDLTILAALEDLASADHETGSPSLIGHLVLLTGFIPRGRGRAPKATQPLEVDPENLAHGLDTVRQRFERLRSTLPELAAVSNTIQHPALGRFSAPQMLAFATIHHDHHHKIIADIRRAVGTGMPA